MSAGFPIAFAVNITSEPAVGVLSYPDCVNGPLKDNLVCDYSAPWLDRAKALVELLTVEEIAANMGHDSAGVPRLGLPKYNWWNEGLHGVVNKFGVTFADVGDYSSATSFPQVINLGSAFDDALSHEIAGAVSSEARAFANAGLGGLTFWTPNINPYRDPRWGRGQEVAGEDAFHGARHAFAWVTGLQGPDAPNYFKVVADCKHMAGYDMDSWTAPDGTVIDRFHFDAKIPLQDMAEYYSLPFRSCVRDAKAGSVMCSYNSFNGVPSCANSYLLQNILRDEWGFGDNWVTGDCKAIEYISSMHNYTSTLAEGSAAAVKAGAEMDCGSTHQATLASAYEDGLVTLDELKRAATRLYGSLVRLGYFDPIDQRKYAELAWKNVNTPSTQQLALKAAEESFVLLKNDGTLPLSVEKYPKLALIGPMGNATTEMQGERSIPSRCLKLTASIGNYYGRPPYITSPLAGFVNAGFEVMFVNGTDGIQGNSTAGFQAAVNAASEADVIVFAGGLSNAIEGEWADRQSIAWLGRQLELLAQLAELGKPVVVVEFGAGKVDDSEIKANDKVNALLWVGYPSQTGGTAIANVITGKAAPAGRLSTTQYPASFTELAMTDMNLRPTDSSPGRTYKWYTGTPVYEFGYGLHYTQFSFAWARLPPKAFSIAKLVAQHTAQHLDQEVLHTFKVAVKNTGAVQSDYVALLFSKTPAGPQPAPLKSLVGYARAHAIAAGKTEVVDLIVTLGAIARADDRGSFVLYPGKYELVLDIDGSLTTSFELVGKETEILSFPQPL
ncbi:beta-xylosidase [Auriculariales sp. MPI-PUGE-AT-0066]|nr:beta-xylosidase [Auriculariales sp. MPI-PUGE-AT-0066]